MLRGIPALVALAIVATSAPAPAEARAGRYGYRAHTRIYLFPQAWYAGVSALGMRIVGQSGGSEQLESGGGLNFYFGLPVADRLALETSLLQSFHNPTQVATWYGNDVDYLVLGGWTFDARLMFPREGSALRPYLIAGIGLYWLESTHFGFDSVGSGFQGGIGFDYHPRPAFGLGLRTRYHGVAMGPPEGGAEDLFISAFSVEGGVSIHF